MIIITTAGRAGSSFLTLFLSNCGLNVGAKKWFEPMNAGMENRQTIDINNRLLFHLVKGEDINLWRVYADIEDLDFDVVKDPSFVTDSRIIEHWWKVRKDLKVVFLYRNPEDVVESVKRLPEWTGPVYRSFPVMINRKNGEFLKKCHDLKIPYMEFEFPDFLDMENNVIEELSEWVDFEDIDGAKIWNKLRK